MKKLISRSLEKSLKSFHSQQGGQILILALILLLLSSIMVIPLAHYINTGIKTTQVFQRNAKEIYAADSGIQSALWKIKYDSAIIADRNTNNYAQIYSYTAPTVNNNSVSVNIAYTWLLSGVINLTNGAYPHDTWIGMDVSGNANPTVYPSPEPHSIYTISYAYSGSGKKKIDQMGVWLPHGFSYIIGSCSHSNFPNNITPDDPTITSVCGGTSLFWYAPSNFSFQDLNPPVAMQQFWYQPAGTTPKGAASWVKAQSNDIGYSWDNAIWWYTVTSTAVDTSVSPNKTTTVNAIVASDPGSPSGLNLVTYILSP